MAPAELSFPSVLVGLLCFPPLVVSSVNLKQARYYDTGLDSVQFTNDTLFEINNGVRSLSDCASRCTREPHCKAFTYRKGLRSLDGASCRGYSAQKNLTQPSVLEAWAKTFNAEDTVNGENQDETTLGPPGPCRDYEVLDGVGRSVDNNSSFGVDDSQLMAGYYRFKLNGKDAIIPTSCQESRYYCASYYPVWFSLLLGEMPGGLGEQALGNACGGGDVSDCCQSPIPIMVQNCGSYYVYYLQPTLQNYNYCTQLL